ncbi:hypothetical protein [Cellulomonas wangsupingiae]|uniref:Extradiol ring-cleavage dioxygenase class III enzyme subunit B domain-containing protein n=1 Tax=Cellulomonas wangsupingiae TaxID=2968085 RepID=A0ABY5K988_9CELL|nr:hypothetical protein [Cellulomonas wangsupingiae]MCC2335232.1 hypothetical protein [Cellulomonas wangsupingiae]UUI66628.1 hypothetical protein NP075_07955 [Cellulomonas wangsupingiae]
MLVAAALVPDTVLLLPGAGGRGPDDAALATLRASAAAAVAGAVTRVARVVVVAPGPADRSPAGVLHLGAAAAGVPDRLLADPVPDVRVTAVPGGPPAAAGGPGTSAVVGARLALAAGVAPVGLHVVEVAPGPAAALRATGAALAGGPPTAFVVVGSGSARHGEGAPLAADERAEEFDDAWVAALRTGGAVARDALAGVDRSRAAELGVTGWAPWQVLVGALDAGGSVGSSATQVSATVWRGAAHAAVTWVVAP